jgi:hypothetical protein
MSADFVLFSFEALATIAFICNSFISIGIKNI